MVSDCLLLSTVSSDDAFTLFPSSRCASELCFTDQKEVIACFRSLIVVGRASSVALCGAPARGHVKESGVLRPALSSSQ